MGGIEEQPGPFGPLDRPFVFATLDEFLTDMPDLEQDAGLFVPAVLFPLQLIGEKAFLQGYAVLRVKFGLVLEAMAFEPLFFGRCLVITLKVAARVQALAAPASG